MVIQTRAAQRSMGNGNESSCIERQSGTATTGRSYHGKADSIRQTSGKDVIPAENRKVNLQCCLHVAVCHHRLDDLLHQISTHQETNGRKPTALI